MDSTACLVGSHVPHVELSFQLFPVGKRGMEKNNPIPGHPQPHLRLILARSHFLRLPEHRAHARVRHICLKRDAGSCDRLRGGICQLQSDRNRADPGWLGRDSVLNRDPGRRIREPGNSRTRTRRPCRPRPEDFDLPSQAGRISVRSFERHTSLYEPRWSANAAPGPGASGSFR